MLLASHLSYISLICQPSKLIARITNLSGTLTPIWLIGQLCHVNFMYFALAVAMDLNIPYRNVSFLQNITLGHFFPTMRSKSLLQIV